jgi:hypothetical protein
MGFRSRYLLALSQLQGWQPMAEQREGRSVEELLEEVNREMWSMEW